MKITVEIEPKELIELNNYASIIEAKRIEQSMLKCRPKIKVDNPEINITEILKNLNKEINKAMVNY